MQSLSISETRANLKSVLDRVVADKAPMPTYQTMMIATAINLLRLLSRYQSRFSRLT